MLHAPAPPSPDTRPTPPFFGALRRATARVGSPEARSLSAELAADVVEGGWRVVQSIRWPTWGGAVDFFTHQVVVNLVGWMAGFATAHLVTRWFEVRGLRNLWGLVASGDRTLVSADHHRLIMTFTGFTVGLLMMLFVRHCLMRWIAETRSLRADRRGGHVATREEHAPSSGVPLAHFEALEAEPEQ